MSSNLARCVAFLVVAVAGCGGRDLPAVPASSEPPLAQPATPAVEVQAAQPASAEDPAPAQEEAQTAPFGPVGNDAPGERRLVLGNGFGCVLLDDRSVVCWGRGSGLADPERGPRALPALEGAIEIVGGEGRVCGRDGAGRVRCAGEPAGSSPLGALEGATSIGAWGGIVCTSMPDGTVRCAGLGTAQAELASTIDDALAVHTLRTPRRGA